MGNRHLLAYQEPVPENYPYLPSCYPGNLRKIVYREPMTHLSKKQWMKSHPMGQMRLELDSGTIVGFIGSYEDARMKTSSSCHSSVESILRIGTSLFDWPCQSARRVHAHIYKLDGTKNTNLNLHQFSSRSHDGKCDDKQILLHKNFLYRS